MGNSIFYGNFVITPNGNSRGICTWARKSSSNNHDTCFNEQCNGGAAAATTVSATVANLSTNIALGGTAANWAVFPVGMPVVFSATANGVYTLTCYFVLSNDGAGNITVGVHNYGAATSFTGNSAFNISSAGYPQFEISAQDSGSSCTGIDYNNIDAEGTSACRILLELAKDCSVTNGYVPGPQSAPFVSLCARSTSYSWLRLGNLGQVLDMDAGSQGNYVSCSRSTTGIANGTYTGVGVGISLLTGSGLRALQSSGFITLAGNRNPEIYVNADTRDVDMGYGVTIDQVPIATAGTWALTTGGNFSFSTAAGGALTMPAITANAVGHLHLFSNSQSNIATLTTSSSQKIGGTLGATSLVVPANCAVLFMASHDATNGYYWDVVGSTQNLPLNAYSIATLLAINAPTVGQKAYVVDTTASAAQAYGTTIAGGGSNSVSGYCYYNTAGNWVWG